MFSVAASDLWMKAATLNSKAIIILLRLEKAIEMRFSPILQGPSNALLAEYLKPLCSHATNYAVYKAVGEMKFLHHKEKWHMEGIFELSK